MQLKAPATWQRMMTHRDARLLMLGTPNGGSWAPMQVLSGDDTFGNTLVAAGAPFHGHDARMEMAGFPGFIQLQAGLLDKTLRLDQEDTWKKLAADDLESVKEHSWWHQLDLQLKAVEWGVPAQSVLDTRRCICAKSSTNSATPTSPRSPTDFCWSPAMRSSRRMVTRRRQTVSCI